MVMAVSREFLTIKQCSASLETALQSDRNIVYYLNRKGFITDEMFQDLVNPRSMLSASQKAGQLVVRIRNRVKLSPKDYHKLVAHLRQSGKQYSSIMEILDREYSRLGETGES